MKFSPFAILLGLCFAQAARAEDCAPLQELASVDFTISPGGALVVQTDVGGKPRQFVIDLADSTSNIDESLAEELQLRQREISSTVTIHINGMKAKYYVNVPQIALGMIDIKNRTFLVVPGSLHLDYDNSIGLDILERMDVEIDFAAHKINFFSQTHCPGKVVYWADQFAAIPFKTQKSGNILIPMTLDGKQLDVGLAVGGAPNEMPLSVAEDLFGLTEAKLQPVDDKHFRYPFQSLSAAGIEIRNPALRIYRDDPQFDCDGKLGMHANGHSYYCYGGAAARLNMAELSHTHLYFAFKEKTLYLTSADTKR